MLTVASWVRLHALITWSIPNAGLYNPCAQGQARLMMIARCFETGVRRLHSVSRSTFCFLWSLTGSGLNGHVVCWRSNFRGIVEITANPGRNVHLFILRSHETGCELQLWNIRFLSVRHELWSSNSHSAPSFTIQLRLMTWMLSKKHRLTLTLPGDF